MLFFDLLQVAVGQREMLSHAPSDVEWRVLHDMARKQAVLGVCFYAVQKLHEHGQTPPQELIYRWFSEAEIIKRRNNIVSKQCYQIQSKFKEAGIRSSILKGQGVAQYYGEELSSCRQSGDIDVYVDGGFERALKFAHNCGQKDVKWDYKHLHLNVFPDTEVEAHYRVEVMLNLQKNRKLQKWFERHTEDIFGHTDSTDNTDSYTGRYAQNHKKNDIKNNTGPTNITDNTGKDSNTNFTNDTNNCPAEIKESAEMVTPSVEFNVFYILLHIYRHFLYEGVGLRQIMDYYFVLKRLNDNHNHNANVNDNTDSYAVKTVKEFGMERFAKGLMWVMQEVFAMPEDWMICKADEKEGRYILSQVMEGGNFGHHDQRLKHGGGKWNTVTQVCKHNWHLMSHYPADVVWAPVWFVWHKGWKLKAKASHSCRKAPSQ